MWWRILIAVVLLAFDARGDGLCLHSAIGEGYDDHEPGDVHVAAVGYSTEGDECAQTTSASRTFKLSASESDPDINSGELSDSQLFLWVIAGDGYGFWNGLAMYEGTLLIEDVQPMNGATVGHSVEPPTLWFERRTPFDVDIRLPVARLTVALPISVQPDTWGRVKALYR